jgi:hypothetical protein
MLVCGGASHNFYPLDAFARFPPKRWAWWVDG